MFPSPMLRERILVGPFYYQQVCLRMLHVDTVDSRYLDLAYLE